MAGMTVGDWPIYPSGDPPGTPRGQWQAAAEALLFLMEVADMAGVTMDDANQALAAQAAYEVSPDQVGPV
jgi:hypothetical protein